MTKPIPKLTLHEVDRMIKILGGEGSGNFGHKGRPGKVGGSGPGGTTSTKNDWKEVRNRLAKEKGFSYQPVLKGFAPKAGFIVSPYADRSKIIPVNEITDADFENFFVDNYDLLKQENHYFGGWFKEEDGKIYFDVSIPVKTDEEANALAVQHYQQAYWDAVNEREVKTRWPKGVKPKFHN